MTRRARALFADENFKAMLFFSLAGLDLALWAVGKGYFAGQSAILLLLM